MDYEDNYVWCSTDCATIALQFFAALLIVLHDYFDGLKELCLDLYLAKFLC